MVKPKSLRKQGRCKGRPDISKQWAVSEGLYEYGLCYYSWEYGHFYYDDWYYGSGPYYDYWDDECLIGFFPAHDPYYTDDPEEDWVGLMPKLRPSDEHVRIKMHKAHMRLSARYQR